MQQLTYLLHIDGHSNFRNIGGDVALEGGYVYRLSYVSGHCVELSEADMAGEVEE